MDDVLRVEFLASAQPIECPVAGDYAGEPGHYGGQLMRTGVAYVTDRKGYELARHAVVSFMLSQKTRSDIWIFCHGFMPEPDDTIFHIAVDRGFLLRAAGISDTASERFPTVGHVTAAALLKFEAVSRLVNDYDRVLYVDNDILFFADISVDAIELDGFPVAAVHDIAEVGGITDAAFLKNCDANHRSRHYFNSGFMLYDSDKWMEASLRAGYMAHLDSHQHYCEYKNPCATNDQCVFNRLFENNWKRLPLDYNFQACAKFTDRWNSASVKHYQGMPKFIPMRPWRLDRRDVRLIRKIRRLLGYRDFGLPYLGISYFLNTIRNHAKINRVESAISAVECLSPQAGSVHGSAV